jgi:ABC-type antimicrobial peptide transport system permease subunit
MIGTGLGLGGALALSHLLESLLFGVSTFDPTVFTLAPLILTGTAMLAVLVPAGRATRVDPVRTLGQG